MVPTATGLVAAVAATGLAGDARQKYTRLADPEAWPSFTRGEGGVLRDSGRQSQNASIALFAVAGVCIAGGLIWLFAGRTTVSGSIAPVAGGAVATFAGTWP